MFMVITMYAPALHEAVLSGDLEKMKATAAQAEEFIKETGDVGAALEQLRLEIAKLEAQQKK